MEAVAKPVALAVERSSWLLLKYHGGAKGPWAAVAAKEQAPMLEPLLCRHLPSGPSAVHSRSHEVPPQKLGFAAPKIPKKLCRSRFGPMFLRSTLRRSSVLALAAFIPAARNRLGAQAASLALATFDQ